MDIKNELKEITLNSDSVNEVIKSIMDEQEKLEKKLHLFNIISLADKIEKFVEEGYFDNPKVISLNLVFDFQNYIYFSTGFFLKDEDNNILSMDDNKIYYEKPMLFFKEIFSDLGWFKVNFMSEDHEPKELILEIGIKDKILDIFLSEELKSIYEYNKMQIDLPDDNISSAKKIKV